VSRPDAHAPSSVTAAAASGGAGAGRQAPGTAGQAAGNGPRALQTAVVSC